MVSSRTGKPISVISSPRPVDQPVTATVNVRMPIGSPVIR
jgi:hypothetical protein